MQICKKMQKCKKLKSTQKCKLKNKIGHQLLVQKSELGRGFRDFRPCLSQISHRCKLLGSWIFWCFLSETSSNERPHTEQRTFILKQEFGCNAFLKLIIIKMKSTFIAFENMTFDQTIQNKDLVPIG